MSQIPESLTIVLGSLATIFFAIFIWWIDIWEREPILEIFTRLLWGAVPAIFITSFVNSFINPFVPASEVFHAIKVAPIVEELCKGFGVFLVMSKNPKEFDSPLDGIVYGSLVGFGFSITENLFYYADYRGSPSGLVSYVVLRSFVFGFNHAFFTAFTGLGFGFFRTALNRLRFVFPFLGYLFAAGFHATHNYLVTLPFPNIAQARVSSLIGILGIAIFLIFLLYEEKLLIRKQLSDEIHRNILTQKHILLASSLRLRLWTDLRLVLFDGNLWKKRYRFLQLAAELAHKKYRFEKLGYREAGMRELQNIRAELSRLSYTMDQVLL